MKKHLYLSRAFWAAALLLSHLMCVTVTYNYCKLECAGQHLGFSAPANIAFLLIPPYAAGILACGLLALFFRRKYRRAASAAQAPNR